MRGSDATTGSMFSYVDIEARVPPQHPIRTIRRIVNEVLEGLDGELAAMYSNDGPAVKRLTMWTPDRRPKVTPRSGEVVSG
jgi:hypothetical protein